jgi:NADH-quinone oxidoreductase subunit G
MEHGRYESRFLENKIKREKAYPIGPHVMLDQERCILCTRCIRFTEEVSKSNELGVFHRGNRSTIELYPEKTLDNLYSGNVIDICPVGALTEREFRFQCRVWYLQTQESICNGCSRGCNINFHFNTSRTYKAGGKRILRVKPRFNPDVNQWWICDLGRFGFPFIDQNRIEYPCVRGAKELEPTSWEDAIDQAASAIQDSLKSHGSDSVGVLVSAQLSNEELLLARKLFVEDLQLSNVALQNPWEKLAEEDGFLLKPDRNPNTCGAQTIGFQGDAGSILEKASSGKIQVLYIFWHSFDNDEALKSLNGGSCVIFQGVNWNQTAEISQVVLPDATHAEKDGTFTNFEGRIQRFRQALLPIEDARPGTEILSLLAERLGHPFSSPSPEEAFLEWQGMPYDKLGDFGVVITEESAVQT